LRGGSPCLPHHNQKTEYDRLASQSTKHRCPLFWPRRLRRSIAIRPMAEYLRLCDRT
jgi:hypothetical protein